MVEISQLSLSKVVFAAHPSQFWAHIQPRLSQYVSVSYQWHSKPEGKAKPKYLNEREGPLRTTYGTGSVSRFHQVSLVKRSGVKAQCHDRRRPFAASGLANSEGDRPPGRRDPGVKGNS